MNARTTLSRWVLLTDDSPTICQMLTHLLRKDGYESRALENYLDLPRLLREIPPVLIILDLERPGGLSGTALGRFVRNFEPRRIPILIFSSLSLEERLEACSLIDADATVGKNESLEEVRKTILRLLTEASHTKTPQSHAQAQRT